MCSKIWLKLLRHCIFTFYLILVSLTLNLNRHRELLAAAFVDYRIVEEQVKSKVIRWRVCDISEPTLKAGNLLILDLLNTSNKSVHDIHTFDHKSVTWASWQAWVSAKKGFDIFIMTKRILHETQNSKTERIFRDYARSTKFRLFGCPGRYSGLFHCPGDGNGKRPGMLNVLPDTGQSPVSHFILPHCQLSPPVNTFCPTASSTNWGSINPRKINRSSGW